MSLAIRISPAALAGAGAIAAGVVLCAASPAVAGQCRDPWITQAIQEVTGRAPTGANETGDCTYSQYGGGHWSSYAELKGYVRQRLAPPSFVIQRGDVPTMSNRQFQALQKWNGNGQSYAYYQGQWMRLVSEANGTFDLISNDGATVANILLNGGAN
jgi:hypothetical protein